MQSLNGVRYWEIIFFIHFSFKQSFANLQIDNAVNICNSESISSELFREHQMPARNKHVLRSFIYNNFLLLLSQNHRVPSSMTSIMDPVSFFGIGGFRPENVLKRNRYQRWSHNCSEYDVIFIQTFCVRFVTKRLGYLRAWRHLCTT